MKTERDLITRAARAWAPTEPSFDDLVRRRGRKTRNRRLGAIVVGLAITISLVASGIAIVRSHEVPADQPTPPSSFRRGEEFIVFAPSTTGSGWDLAAQDPTTGDVRTIVETDGLVDCVVVEEPCTTFVKEADWSADGRWVAFRVTNRSLYGEPLGSCGPTVGLWVATADGEPRQLTTPCEEPPSAADAAIEEMWAWSPEGDRLAYVRIDGDTDELFVIDPSDGRRTSLVTRNIDPLYMGGWGRLAWSLAWAPDSSQIAYAEGGSVYAVSVEGGERSLLADGFNDIIDIAWSPDGAQILVRDQGMGLDLYRVQVMNADGSDLHVALEGVDACCRSEWSPNGGRIVYELPGDATTDSESEVWTVSSDGVDRIKVFDSDGCEMRDDPRSVWAPDGTQVAFIGCGGEEMVANADGTGTPRRIERLVWRSWYSGGLIGWDALDAYGDKILAPRAAGV